MFSIFSMFSLIVLPSYSMFSHLGWQDGTIRGALSTIKNSLVVTSLPYFWTSGSYVILIVIIQEYLDTCAQSLLERPWSACNPTLITLRCPQSYTNQPANTLVLKKDMFTHYTCFQENITNHTFTNTFGNLIFCQNQNILWTTLLMKASIISVLVSSVLPLLWPCWGMYTSS